MAAGAVAVTVTGFGLRLGRPLRDDGLGRQQHAGDRGRVTNRGAGDLDRVDDTGLHQVAVLPGRGIQPVAGGQLPHLAHDDVALVSGVLRDPAQRLDERRTDDVDARGLVTGEPTVAVERGRRRDECASAAGDDALLDRCTGGRDRVLEPVLPLLELDLGGRADADDADAACELRQPLLQLLAVPVGVAGLDLATNLTDAVLDRALLARAVDDRRVVLRDGDPTRFAENVHVDAVELEADLLGDDLAAGEDRHVLQHRLAAVTEARRLHGDRGEGATDLVDDERRQRLTLDVLCHDEQRLAGLHDLLEQRQQLTDGADLALHEQDVGVVEDGLHALRVGDEVRRDVALVELHALGELELETHRLGFFDRDHAVLADLAERLGDELTDLRVLRGDRGDLRDLGLVVDLAGILQQALADRLDGGVDAALERHRLRAGRDVAQTLAHHGLGEHGRGGGAVTGDVVGLGRHFLGELGAHVLVGVLELDLFGDGDAVVGDGRRAPLLVDDDVATLGAERHLHRVGEPVDAALQRVTGVGVELQDLRHSFPLTQTPRRPHLNRGSDTGASANSCSLSTTARTSRADRMRYSSVPNLTSVPPYFEKMTVSPSLTSIGVRWPSSKRPGPTARTLPSCGFSFAVSGITMPDAVVCSDSST